MKHGFATRRSLSALRFMAATPPHHRCKASASYSRSECFIDNVSKEKNVVCLQKVNKRKNIIELEKRCKLWYNFVKIGVEVLFLKIKNFFTQYCIKRRHSYGTT